MAIAPKQPLFSLRKVTGYFPEDSLILMAFSEGGGATCNQVPARPSPCKSLPPAQGRRDPPPRVLGQEGVQQGDLEGTGKASHWPPAGTPGPTV